MAIIKRFLRNPVYICDRCKQPISYLSPYTLCDDCFRIDSSQIRRNDLDDLILFKNTDGTKCNLCGTSINEHSNHVCRNCISTHPDDSHGSFWSTPSSLGEKIINSCPCGNVQIITTIDIKSKRFEYLYYRLGSKIPSSIPVTCTLNHDLRSVEMRRNSCKHEWIIIDSDNVDESTAKKNMRSWKDAKYMLGLDNDMIEVLSYGTTSFWCWKCGGFRRLTEKDYKKLPIEGGL